MHEPEPELAENAVDAAHRIGFPGDDPDALAAPALARAHVNLNYWLFPGLVLHELAHVLACLLAGIRVHDVKLWGPRGAHVTHSRPRHTLNAILVSVFPALVGGVAAWLFLEFAFREPSLVSAFYYWLALSFAVYAFPSPHDLRAARWNLKRAAQRPRPALAALSFWLAYPFLALLDYAFELHYAVFGRNALTRLIYFAVLFYFAGSGV